ncbi:XRE family transcriptional regulator [Terrabacter sp. Ter38]|jgi:transcriptional regulator with XRE-family HTH domain|uniref:XRE family transcriptional regulator n=1 Tax=Terrabacter sp. Ter38 TaxID=2926030 RepID=UPI002117E33E|nr:XRE family transcriptional regulator [Terrabacter sp. Ter38]
MTNERLRAAITSAGLNLQTFSEQVGVDPKTVERWITKDRSPHRTHRMNAAVILGKSDGFLWPATESDRISRSATEAELVRLYPSRGAIDADMWLSLVDDAKESIDLLAYAGSFLHDAIPGFVDRLSARSRSGVRVRLLFGDPASEAVALRGREEGIDELMAARCKLTWKYLVPAIGPARMQARRHGTTLYASIFRFDDVLLANPHAYGASASHSPVLHINRIPGGRLFSHYMDSYDRVWATAQPV